MKMDKVVCSPPCSTLYCFHDKFAPGGRSHVNLHESLLTAILSLDLRTEPLMRK